MSFDPGNEDHQEALKVFSEAVLEALCNFQSVTLCSTKDMLDAIDYSKKWPRRLDEG